MIPVLWCSHHPEILARGYADQGLLEAVFDRSLWTPPDALVFKHHEVRDEWPAVDGAVVVVNARTHVQELDWLQAGLESMDWSVLLLCGDEEWDFPWREVHDQDERRRVWAMQARPEHQALGFRFLPGGWYPRTRELLAPYVGDDRPLDWFFAGQVTHARRQACASALRSLRNNPEYRGELVETSRYLEEGISRADYFRVMASAKVVPSPSGPYSVDCARTFEALEAGCVPVADLESAFGPDFNYWTLLFGGEVPFPLVKDWGTFPRLLAVARRRWPRRANRCWSFWQAYKRDLVYRLEDDVRACAGLAVNRDDPNDQITVLVTTSPVSMHPDTSDLQRTLASIRDQLPTAEIIICCDGVRPEQEALASAYETYLNTVLRVANFDLHNVLPVVLDQWGHQANTLRAGLELVTTPLVLVVEHDTPLVNEIPWAGICEVVRSGQANLVRFHHEAGVLPVHEHLMLDREPQHLGSGGVPMLRCAAWWNRPHLASTRFYREEVMPNFSLVSRTMVEDLMYARIWTEYADDGEAAWWRWRLWQYAPEDGMVRSLHLDSRAGAPKYDMSF